MHRDHQQQSGFKTHGHERKEWGRSSDQEHPMEAREHVRPTGKTQRAYVVRNAEAKRQIRELRERY